MKKTAPTDRHRLRMKSFYVDLQENETTWSRPREIADSHAREAVMDAVNDYSVQRDRLFNVPGDPTMMGAMAAMNPAPDIRPPRWPNRLI